MLAILNNGTEYVFLKGWNGTYRVFFQFYKTNLESRPQKKPLNPMINAGAIATSSLISGKTQKKNLIIYLISLEKICENNLIDVNNEVTKAKKLLAIE